MRAVYAALVLTSALAVLSGCATSSSPNVYSRSEAMKAWSVARGKVVDIQSVQIDGTHTAVGTIGGGYVGYEVGRSIGHGSGRAIAGAVGSVAGAVAGRAVERAATRQQALQITVELEGGETIAIVQADDVTFASGEHVKVLRRGNGQARVTKA